MKIRFPADINTTGLATRRVTIEADVIAPSNFSGLYEAIQKLKRLDSIRMSAAEAAELRDDDPLYRPSYFPSYSYSSVGCIFLRNLKVINFRGDTSGWYELDELLCAELVSLRLSIDFASPGDRTVRTRVVCGSDFDDCEDASYYVQTLEIEIIDAGILSTECMLSPVKYKLVK